MKKIIFFIFFTALLIIPLNPVLAAELENPLDVESFEELLEVITNFIFWVGMALAPLLLILAGFLFVTSAGSPGQVETAKKIALYATIALVVLLLAKGLIAVLKSILGVL